MSNIQNHFTQLSEGVKERARDYVKAVVSQLTPPGLWEEDADADELKTLAGALILYKSGGYAYVAFQATVRTQADGLAIKVVDAMGVGGHYRGRQWMKDNVASMVKGFFVPGTSPAGAAPEPGRYAAFAPDGADGLVHFQSFQSADQVAYGPWGQEAAGVVDVGAALRQLTSAHVKQSDGRRTI